MSDIFFNIYPEMSQIFLFKLVHKQKSTIVFFIDSVPGFSIKQVRYTAGKSVDN